MDTTNKSVGGAPERPADVLITGNDRAFVCTACKTTANNGARRQHDWASSITFDGHFLNTNQLYEDVSHEMAVLNDNITRYKAWLKKKQERFEHYFTESFASEELFNQLNLIVAQIKQGLKMLTSWYMSVQEIVSDVWDGIRAYESAKNVLVSYGAQNEQSYSIGLSVNPVALAKKNRTKSKVYSKQTTKALSAETVIRQALFQLESELNAFNQGIVRTQNGKFVNLVDLGDAIDALYNRESPLVRVQQEVAHMINRAEIKVTLEHDALPVIGKAVERKSFAVGLEDAKMPTEFDLMSTLHDIANNSLYTVNTKASIDKTIDYADKNIETKYNRALLAELTQEIRANSPVNVIKELQMSMRQKEDLFENVARIKRLLKHLHRADVPILSLRLNDLLTETLQSVSESVGGDETVAEVASGSGMDAPMGSH